MIAESVIVISLLVSATAVCIVVLGVQAYMLATGKITDKDPSYKQIPYHH